MPEWRRLPGGPSSMPLEFLVDVALTRAVRRTDLATVRTVLVDALDAGISATTAMHQATRLLRRATRLIGT